MKAPNISVSAAIGTVGAGAGGIVWILNNDPIRGAAVMFILIAGGAFLRNQMTSDQREANVVNRIAQLEDELANERRLRDDRERWWTTEARLFVNRLAYLWTLIPEDIRSRPDVPTFEQLVNGFRRYAPPPPPVWPEIREDEDGAPHA